MTTTTSSAPQLTPEQHAAIFTRDVSIALSAGAGCGKTFVLTERFLSHLDPGLTQFGPPAQLGELIAITFTERAAREMRDRIRSKCFQRLQAAEPQHAEHWQNLLRSLDSARVSTIHAFCATLLRQHAVEAGLDPGFAVLDQMQADTLLTETMEDTLRELLIAQDETTIDLVVQFGLERLQDMVAQLLSQGTKVDYEFWETQTPEELVLRWQDYHQQVYLATFLRKVANGRAARDILRVLKHEIPDHPVMAQRREILLELLPQLCESEHPLEDLATIKENAAVKGGGTKKNWGNETDYTTFQKAAERLRKDVAAAISAFDFNTEAAYLDAAAGLTVLELAARIREKYDAKKREVSGLDFTDLMRYTRQMLRAPENRDLRTALANRTKLLLVDEFQDTDPEQVELVKALCGDGIYQGKLFFVGDRKQSIYRFRGAQPEVFRQLKLEIPPQGRLPLKTNFRSQANILDFVNALFADEFADDDGESVLLDPRRAQTTQPPAIEFMWAQAEGRRTEKGATERARRLEARWIARRIRQMLDQQQPLAVGPDQQPRPAEPGDIAILFRALSNVAYYEQALQEYGIDYYLVGGHAFYAQQEIFDLLNLLRSVDSSCDDVSLAGVLRSPFFSLTDETLYWLSSQGSLLAGLFSHRRAVEIEPEQLRRVKFAAELLSELREAKDRLPIADLINRALSRTGYDALLLTEFLGERKLANIRKLIQQARMVDRSGILSLADFIVQLSQFVAKQPHEPLAATHPENTNVVKLMTIHQSKGLEFPVVFVPDIDRPSNRVSASIEFSAELGPLVRSPATSEIDATSGITGLDLHALVTAEEEQAEMNRLFYVATTRAADHLILSSSVFDLESPAGPWLRLLGERFSLYSGKFIADSTAELKPPVIRVLLEEPVTLQAPLKRNARTDLAQLHAQGQAHLQASYPEPKLVRPVAVDPQARRQFSFSRLSGELKTNEVPFAQAEETEAYSALSQVDPLGLGTLTHAVLAQPHLKAENVLEFVKHFAVVHQPDAGEEALRAVARLIARFLESPTALAVNQASKVYHELELLLGWPIIPSLNLPETQIPPATGNQKSPSPEYLLRGFIDCLYQDTSGDWHLLDYKTNNVTETQVPSVAEQYRLQMYVYALACETVLGHPPSTLTLHFLRPGTNFTFDWTPAAHLQATHLINETLAKASLSNRDPLI